MGLQQIDVQYRDVKCNTLEATDAKIDNLDVKVVSAPQLFATAASDQLVLGTGSNITNVNAPNSSGATNTFSLPSIASADTFLTEAAAQVVTNKIYQNPTLEDGIVTDLTANELVTTDSKSTLNTIPTVNDSILSADGSGHIGFTNGLPAGTVLINGVLAGTIKTTQTASTVLATNASSNVTAHFACRCNRHCVAKQWWRFTYIFDGHVSKHGESKRDPIRQRFERCLWLGACSNRVMVTDQIRVFPLGPRPCQADVRTIIRK